ncbi:MAG: 4Fe-4S binding protein, partial [Anaerolineae bacterium]
MRVALRWSPRRWTALRKGVQYAALLTFVVLFVWSRRGGWPAAWVNLPMRLDPLAMLAHALASRTLLAGSAAALLTVALALALGRAWCGWLCPLGTLLDLFPLRRERASRRALPEGWRGVKYALLFTLLWAALLGNLTLMVLDPLTLLFRSLSAAVWPVVDQAVTGAERVLYQVPFLQGALSAFDGWARPKVLPPEPAFYRLAWLYGAILLGLVALNGLAPRFWCRYLCPLGAFLGLWARVGLARREVNDRCIQCDACAQACPTGTIRAEQGYASDPAECTVCLECLAACPAEAIGFPVRLGLAAPQPYDPGRRQALGTLAAAAAGVGLFR